MVGSALRFWRIVSLRIGFAASSLAFMPSPMTWRLAWLWLLSLVCGTVLFVVDIAAWASEVGKWLTQLEHKSRIRPFWGRVSV